MLKVGLTGNIGSGKTLVAEVFKALGAPVFHADQEAKKLYQIPEVREKLRAITGSQAFNLHGEVDRQKMAALLFNDRELLGRVNQLVHPMVRELFDQFCAERNRAPYCVYEAAILVESGYYSQMDRVVVVYAPASLRFDRVMKRDGISRQDVMVRATHQAPDEEKIKVADWVIYNDGSRMVIPQVLLIDGHLRQESVG